MVAPMHATLPRFHWSPVRSFLCVGALALLGCGGGDGAGRGAGASDASSGTGGGAASATGGAGGRPSSSGGTASSSGGATASSGGTAASSGGGTSANSGGGTASSSGGATSSSGGTSASGGGATSSSGGTAGAGGALCATDPLRTGLTPPDGDDEFDCAILAATQKYAEPDAMIFKAIIHAESRFAFDAVACANLPCGTPTGWTAGESGCYGLMQIVPACTGANKQGLLPSGHPNLTTNKASADWPTSIFNPSINIDVGVYGVADNRKQVKKSFPGCTEDQYTLMAIGNYNSYGSTKSCTVYNTAYDNEVLKTYRLYAQAAGWPAHPY
jgi:hypothetical protein